jgi:ferric-dicitrate binding protein FerR (iron transport regulator)
MLSIDVPIGSRTSVTLPDGTSVWLNSNSNLVYPDSFTGDHRIVELDGEAYFEVAKDERKPFIVKTDKYNVEVLGTAFNLEAYATKPVFKTTLFEGKVRLFSEQRKDEYLCLNPGEAAELVDGHLQVISANNNSFRWKDGLIVLEGQSFQEVLQLFQKYFDLNIVIRNEDVKDQQYEGKLRIADGIDHALRVLQTDFRFTYYREAETNIIYIE